MRNYTKMKQFMPRFHTKEAVPNSKGRQVIAFRLINDSYQQCLESVALVGLPISLLEQALEQMVKNNGNAAKWFALQIKDLPIH